MILNSIVQILILSSLFLFSGDAFSKTLSVEEMYLDIPSELVGLAPAMDAASKKKEIQNLDNKNGFLALKGESQIEIAKFNRKQGGPLLAVAGTSYADSRGLSDPIRFYEQKSPGIWTDVTPVFLPPIPDIVIDAFARAKCGKAIANSASGTYRYRLPHRGKIIRAIAESDVLSKPCRGDLFHLTFVEEKIINVGWMTSLVMELN